MLFPPTLPLGSEVTDVIWATMTYSPKHLPDNDE